MIRGIDRLRPHAAALSLLLLTGLATAFAAPTAARADETVYLGRLFLTPEQRRELDEQRAKPSSRVDTALPKDLLPARMAVDRRIVMNGVVRRGGADPVAWINGQPATRSVIAGGRVRVHRGPDAENRVTLESTGSNAVARLKPGQSWDTRTGRISDCTDCGVPKPAPEAVPAAAADPAAVVPAGAVEPAAPEAVPAVASAVGPAAPPQAVPGAP